MRLKLSILAFLLLAPFCLPAQRYTINGYISDRQTGERLIGATVLDSLSGYGAVTTNSGFYSLTLPTQQVRLKVSYVGYAPQVVTFRLTRDTLLSFSLTEQLQLDEVTVVAQRSLTSPESAQMSAVQVPVTQIKGIPALMGEVDVLKALQLLPGVQGGTEGSTGMYVRGGGPDENLIMLDGVPLYNVNHMMGFFSVFNADAVKNVTLYKGDFPAHFGSRLSSVVDVRQNDGNINRYNGEVTVGLLSAKAGVNGPIYWNREQREQARQGTLSENITTFSLSARRTYFDLFTAPLMAILSRREMDGGSVRAGFYFYDVNAKLTHRFNDNDKLSASFYMGDDVIYTNVVQRETPDSEPANVALRWNWGNLLAALSWEHRYSPRLFSTTQMSYTRYRYNLNQTLSMEMAGETNTTGAANTSDKYSIREGLDHKSRIEDLAARMDFIFNPSPKNELRYGADYTFHRFRPEIGSLMINTGNAGFNIDTILTDGTLMSHEAAVYVEDNYIPCQWLRLNVGVRGSLYAVDGKVWPSVEPRGSVRFMLYKGLALKASYAYMSQYVHLLSNSNISLPTDLWVPVTSTLPPMRCMQTAAGLTYDLLGQVELSVEGYYKKMLNLIEYKDGARFLGSTTGWQDKVCVGEGWSYGVELLAQRKVGKLTGWIGYTWSRTMRLFNREGQQINFGKPFHAKYDREHDLSITLMYQVTPRIDLSATFVYSTGNRATLSTQVYYSPMTENYVSHVEERNNYQLPDYHRLDLGANFHFPSKRLADAEHLLNIGIYNVYNNMNPFLLYPDGDKLAKLTLFPVLPNISYSFKF